MRTFFCLGLFLTLSLFHPIQSAQFSLSRGWNFISIPISQRIPIESFLDLHGLQMKSIWLWKQELDNGAGGWAVYPRYAGFENLAEFEPRRGYWIQSAKDLELEVENIIDDPKDYAFAFQNGMHSIGFGSANISIEPEVFFSGDSIPRVLWGWNPDQRIWEFNSLDIEIRDELIGKGFLEFQRMNPGQGYYVISGGVKYPRVPFLRGPRGIQGPRGERGEQGHPGPRGEKGEPGDVLTGNAEVQDLRINGLLQLSKHFQEPVQCDDENALKIALTGNHRLCLCDGNHWIFLNSNQACEWFSFPFGAGNVSSNPKIPAGMAGVRIKLTDALSGDPIDGATISLGKNSTSQSSAGQYVFSLQLDSEKNSPDSEVLLRLGIQAEGYRLDENTPSDLLVIDGHGVDYSIALQPDLGTVVGQLSFEKFAQLYDISLATIQVDGIPDHVANSKIDAHGFFSVQVPVSTPSNERSYTVRVYRKGFLDQVVSDISSPIESSAVVVIPPLIPQTVTIVGTVGNPFTQFPAVVVEADLEGGITGGGPVLQGTLGTYSIDGVPTHTDQPLTIKAITYEFDEAGTFPPDTSEAEIQFTALNNGSGVFRISNLSGGEANDTNVESSAESEDNANSGLQESTQSPQEFSGRLEGRVTYEKFENLFDLSRAVISVDGLSGSTSADFNGFFSFPVPLREENESTSFTLRVNRRGFHEQKAINILGPKAGSIRVDIPPLVPKTVTIVGTVENPFTQFPAVVVEAGLEGGITGGTPVVQGTLGTYSINGVPTNTDQPLTVKVITYQFDEAGTFPPDTNEEEQQFTATDNENGVYRVTNISSGGIGN